MPGEAANAFKEYLKLFTSSATEIRITSFSVLSLTTESSRQHGFEISEILRSNN